MRYHRSTNSSINEYCDEGEEGFGTVLDLKALNSLCNIVLEDEFSWVLLKESPFEFRALEVALESICSSLAASTRKLESEAYIALDEFTTKINSQNLDLVRKIKSKMKRLTARVQKVRDELEQVLDDDEDTADLYMTRKLGASTSPLRSSDTATWPAIIGRTSRASVATNNGDDDDVEEVEM